MRCSGIFAILLCACGGGAAEAPRTKTPEPLAPPAPSSPKAEPNGTGLELEPVSIPVSQAGVRVDSPQPGDHVALGAAREYTVHWSSEHLEPDALGIDLALDAYRPHRVAANETVITLGALVPADEELLAGEHWFFAAPVAASGLVPGRVSKGPRTAVAVRFFLGDTTSKATPSGVIWLRKPEGTYNGGNAEHALFDVLAFDASGKPAAFTGQLSLRGKASGELELSSPFSVRALASGDYAVTATTPGLAPVTRAFTVNAELGGPK